MKPNQHIGAMAPYALADLAPDLISLAQNESVRAPCPASIGAAQQALGSGHLYPDPDWTDLRHAISAVHDVGDGEIVCGAGSMELIGAMTSAYLGPGDRALTSQYAYAFFATATRLAGATIDFAPENDLTVDCEALLHAVRPETKIVFIANPGNPTGTRLSRAELGAFRDALPAHVFLVLDEAYGEFADAPGEACFDLVARGDTAVLRTMSKAYGLAGMRVGWGVFPAGIASNIRKILNPNNVSGASQAAAAAAMRNQGYMRETVSETATLRDEFADRLRGMGLEIPISHTNFVLIRFPSATAMMEADTALKAGGILMRGMSGYGLADCLRATVGGADAMRRAGDILEGIQT